MGKVYTELELKEMGMDSAQIKAILSTQKAIIADGKLQDKLKEEALKSEALDADNIEKFSDRKNIIQKHEHNVKVYTESKNLVPTSINEIAEYKKGTIVELPPFGDGQPFIARMSRPSMLSLVKKGKIPNTLINKATSLFAKGVNALGGSGKESIDVNELFDVIEAIADSALIEPTLSDIRSVGMELTDDQLMAIFAYTQKGVKALEQFRTE